MKGERIKVAALTLLGEGKTIRAVAKQLGINKNTVLKWKKENEESFSPTSVNPVVKDLKKVTARTAYAERYPLGQVPGETPGNVSLRTYQAGEETSSSRKGQGAGRPSQSDLVSSSIALDKSKKIKVSDRYANYVDTLRTVKDRQGKWAGAITETGIRSLKLANKFLAVVEKKEQLNKQDLELVRLIPHLLSSSTQAVKSAGEAEDRAYSLELLMDTLNDLPQQVKSPDRSPNPKPVVADD